MYVSLSSIHCLATAKYDYPPVKTWARRARQVQGQFIEITQLYSGSCIYKRRSSKCFAFAAAPMERTANQRSWLAGTSRKVLIQLFNHELSKTTSQAVPNVFHSGRGGTTAQSNQRTSKVRDVNHRAGGGEIRNQTNTVKYTYTYTYTAFKWCLSKL